MFAALIVVLAFFSLAVFACIYFINKLHGEEMRNEAIWMAAHDKNLPDDKKIKYIIGVLKSKKFPFIPEEL